MNIISEFLTQSNFIAGLIGGFIVWIITQVKTITEINKMDKEVTNIKVMLNKELYALESQRKVHFQKTNQFLKELLIAIREDKDNEIPDIWDRINNSFFINYLGSSYQIIRTTKILLGNNNLEMKDFIDDELFPLLKLSVGVLDLLNREKIQELNRQRKVIIADPTFNLAFKTIKRNTRIWDFKRRKKLKLYRETMQKYK